MSNLAADPTARSSQLYHDAQRVLPGGVNSPVRAMRSIGRDPIFIASGHGSKIVDVDGNEYVDWVGSWGPLILGHAHPDVVAAVTDAAERGTTFGAPTEADHIVGDLIRRGEPQLPQKCRLKVRPLWVAESS